MNGQISVAQVIDTTDIGGAERTAISLANALAKRGVESHIIVTRHLGLLADEILPDVKVKVLNRKCRFNLLSIRKVIEYLKEWNIRILHAHSRTSAFWCFMWRLLGKRSMNIIFHDHDGTYELQSSISKKLIQLFDKYILWLVNGCIVVSKSLEQKYYLTDSSSDVPVMYMKNTIELCKKNYKQSESHKRKIIQIANVRHEKGHLNIVDIAINLKKYLKDFEWMCIGSISDAIYYNKINRRLSAYNLENNVTFYGNKRDIYSWLATAYMGVLTSDAEGLPLALLEYMAAGLPVVVTDVGQCREIVENAGCGFVVPRGNYKEFAKSISWLVNHPCQAKEMGNRGQKVITENYSIENNVTRLLDFYYHTLSDTLSYESSIGCNGSK